MTRRNNCLVPFCTHTTGKYTAPGVEWICADHWLATSRNTRRLFFKAKRRRRRELFELLWRRLRRQAIERAGGIG